MKQEKLVNLLLSILANSEREEKSSSDSLFEIGEKYFIRTVTYHAIGKCVDIVDGFVFLDEAMWVADSGRLSNALKEGMDKQSSAELEVFPSTLRINISSIVDFTEYEPKIILLQK